MNYIPILYTEIPSDCLMQGQAACLVGAAESLAVTLALGIFLYVLYTPLSVRTTERAFRFPLRLL